MDSHAELYFPILLSDRSGFKESGNRSGNFDLNNTNKAGTVMVSTTLPNATTFSTKYAQSINWSKSGKSCISQKGKLATPGIDSFREKLSSKGLSKDSLSYHKC